MSGRIRVLRTIDGAAKPAKVETFVEGLDQPFGIAFYPAGPAPQWVYIANTNSVVRIPYRSGDLTARGPAETVVAKLTVSLGGHWTRDIAFSPDDSKMYVSVGSASNLADHMGEKTLAEAQAFDADHGPGAAWGPETDRADVLTFTPQGGAPQVYAGGLRNCVALTLNSQTNDLWCAVNERDGLGDNLVPDYATRVKPGGFYGWPWYYMGGVEDPRLKGRRPDLAGMTRTPDVPIQSHSAPLGLVFYPLHQTGPAAFPQTFRGDAFVALHGSWNRALRTGYKVVRLKLRDGVPTGAYEDFLTGFVTNDHKVWGRPVGVTVAHDGALLMSEDGNGTIWRVAYTGAKP
jgi:glucose/arabinose dehydrogenase